MGIACTTLTPPHTNKAGSRRKLKSTKWQVTRFADNFGHWMDTFADTALPCLNYGLPWQ
jgi:hypothetical protein